MRVALSADMEGVSQLEDWRAILAFDPAYWREGRAQMEAEVAAAARGLLSGGADEVIVCPFFLGPGKHWQEDIPRLAAEAAEVFEVRHHVAAPLGLDDLMLKLLDKRISQGMPSRPEVVQS